MSPEQVNLNNWLRLLAEDWQLSCLTLNSEGCCSVRTEDGIHLQIEAPPELGHILLSAELGELPETNTAALLIQLMENNIKEGALGLAYFGLIPDSRSLCLRYHHATKALNAESLGNIICNFIETASKARDSLTSQGQNEQGSNLDAWVRI